MAKGRQFRVTDPEYGTTCPRCAGPKYAESGMCWDCYTDARRRLEYPLPPMPLSKYQRIIRSPGERGRPQPQSHPWRRYWRKDAA